jgi:hypothetical protein
MPDQGLNLFVPMHYPMQGDDNLQLEIFKNQQRLVLQGGIDESLAGLPHYEIYGQMLEVAFVESVATTRYGSPRRPPGFVDRLNHGLSEYLKISVDHIQRLRKAVKTCRKGDRKAIKFLRPRQR